MYSRSIFIENFQYEQYCSILSFRKLQYQYQYWKSDWFVSLTTTISDTIHTNCFNMRFHEKLELNVNWRKDQNYTKLCNLVYKVIIKLWKISWSPRNIYFSILTYERWILVIAVLSRFELKLSLNTSHKMWYWYAKVIPCCS